MSSFARLALASALAAAALLVSSCGGPVVAQAEGSGCSALQSYTCNLEEDTILYCDGSSIWRRQVGCDQGSACVIQDPEGAAAACCLVGGTETCFPEGTPPAGDGDEN